MRVIAARLRGFNLTKPWFFDNALVRNGTKGFLVPLPTTISSNRGAKTVDCGITWVKPIEPACTSKAKSGDLGELPKVPSDLVPQELKESEVLQSAPPEVKKLYTFAYFDRVKRKEMIEDALKIKVKRHLYDEDSREVKLAIQTATILRLQHHMETRPNDKRNKVVLKELIDKRKKRLKNLRRCNYKLFEWILERLNLVYYPPPPDCTRPMRSVSMSEIATKFCEDLKAARLEKYRIELEERKPEFLRKKAQTMRAIVEDEKKLKVAPSFTEEEILEVEKLRKEKIEELSRAPKPVEDIF